MIDFDLSTGLAQGPGKTTKNFEGIMSSIKTPLMALLLLAACDGNSLITAVDPVVDPIPDPDGIHSEHALPPGTESPAPNTVIVRREAKDNTGNGYVEGVSYNADNDTFSVDGLAFDGGNVYHRGTSVASLGPTAVYEAASSYSDDVTGAPIDQFSYRALYGVSTSGQTEFAIIRTGAYIPYGFGGFIYQRNGGVTLPTSGQAHYEGDYSGLRDFNGINGVEYATGDMTMDIDFNDFNQGNGVKGEVTNRAVLDANGNDVTNDILTALNANLTNPLTELPTLTFTVGPGVMDANGEIAGAIGSYYTDGGAAVTYETGNYYAIVSGDAAEEVVGVIVVEGADPRYTGVTVRETGGFILYRE